MHAQSVLEVVPRTNEIVRAEGWKAGCEVVEPGTGKAEKDVKNLS